MSFYFDRLDAARRQQQMAALPAAAAGCSPPPRPWPCYRYQHAAALLPRSPPPVPVPPLHAGVGSVAVARGAAGGAAGWNAVAAAGGWVGDAARGGARSVPTDPAPAREEAGGVGGGEVRNKRCSPAPTPGARSPPPKRRAVAAFRRFPPGCGRDAAAAPPLPVSGDSRSDPARRDGCSGALQDSLPPPPTTTLAGGKDSVLFKAAAPSPSAAASPGSISPNKVSADGAAGATTDDAPGPSAAPNKNSVSASDGLGNDTASRGVAVPGSGDQSLKTKDDLLVTSVRFLPKPSMVSAYRRFPPGCGRPGPPLLPGGGSSQLCSPSSVQAVAEDRDELETVAPVRSGTEDGAAQNEGLEEGEVAPRCSGTEDGAAKSEGLEEGNVIASEVQESPSATVHCGKAAAACIDGNYSSEEMIENAWQSEENRSGGSSCNIVAESLSQGLPKEHLETEIASECATDTASSGAAAAVSEEGATMRKKVMFTPRKSVKPPKSIHKPALHDEATTACRHGTSSSEVGNTWQCEDESKSGGSSSCNVAAESLSQGLPKEHLETESMSECATDTASSGAAAGVSDGGATTRKKVMFTPRKSVKPPKSIQKPALNTHGVSVSFSKETEQEKTQLGRHSTNGIEDTDDFTKDRQDPIPMSADKCPWTNKGKESAIITHYFGPKKKKVSDKEDSILKHDEVLKALAAVHEAKFEPGPQDADARSNVKMLCSRFESICRSIVQAVEQRSLKIRRVDLAADKVIRKLPGFTKPGPIVGNVPGVEVGDEFLYRVQLALVGLHRPYQGGIDTTRDEHGMLIAISIVASGGYPDELSCPGELIYTGSGGKKGGGDQKLENGNLALRNCVERKSPVRVIHGFKGQNREEGSHSRAKEVSRFTYDGLYRVVNCWREGRPGSKVLKYKLQRIPGQPGLPLQVAKFVKKNNT
ncbi:unnamed protein product [Urochloa decumbens]|uniref:YDG domain-containing protein n=1 Tax=Urochloa decumbens TaxID=240449 RepID=A0ABC9BVW1_9POAL